MELDDKTKARLGVAFNEAALLGVEVMPDERVAAATLAVLTLPEVGDPLDDPRLQLLFAPVGRVAASLRLGRWDDPNAEVVPVEVDALLGVVQSFEGLPIYGWEFFDRHKAELAKWGDGLSLDYRSGPGGVTHSLLLFQDGGNRHLDILIWFDDLIIRDAAGRVLTLDEVAAGGERWWKALDRGDPRTAGSGIVPLKDSP